MTHTVLLHQRKHAVAFGLQFGEVEMAMGIDKHLRIIANRSGGYALRRNKSAFAITLTLESAIAAPAIMGLSMPAAASGMPITL